MPEPGIRSCRALRLRPPSAAASEPSAANSQRSLRLPPRPSSRARAPRSSARRASTSGCRTPRVGPPVTAVTRRVATSTTWMSWRSRGRGRAAVRRRTRSACRPATRPARRPRRPIRQPGRVAGRHVDEPQVLDPVVQEARAVEHVGQPVDEAVVRRRAARPAPASAPSRAGWRPRRGWRPTRRGRRPGGCRRATTRMPSRRAAGRSAGAPRRVRRAAAGGPGYVLALLDSLGRRALLQDPAIRQEGERPAVRRESRMLVVSGTSVSWRGGRRPPRSVETSHNAAVAVVGRRNGLQRDDGPAPVGRERGSVATRRR